MKKIPIYQIRRIRRDTRAVETLGYFGRLESARKEVARVSGVPSVLKSASWSKRLDNRQTVASGRYIYVMDRNWLRDPEVVQWANGKSGLDTDTED